MMIEGSRDRCSFDSAGGGAAEFAQMATVESQSLVYLDFWVEAMRKSSSMVNQEYPMISNRQWG